MDQLKTILALIKKHHFWALCGVVIVVGLSVWTTATADLSRQFAQRQSKLNGDLSRVTQISNQTDPPNEKVIAAIRQEHDKLKGDVLNAWTFLYNQQKEKNPWPKELGQDFLDMINGLGRDREIPEQFLPVYRYFIPKYLPELFKIVGARVPTDALDASRRQTTTSVASPGTSRTAGKEETTYFGNKVFWENSDWDRIMKSFNFSATPTSLEVRLKQEDLWVYEALLRIINQTNAGATSYDNAAVKRIINLQIGKDAANYLQRGKVSAAGMMGAEGGEPGGGSRSMPGGGGPDGDAAAASLSPEQKAALELKQGRYVDEKLVPLAAGAAEPFEEFKIMPIRMCLVMDQRKIPALLTECANSSMPVEVQEVHFGTGIDTSRSIRSGSGAGSISVGASAPSSVSGVGSRSTSEEAGSYDMPVEIVGTIYIYNLPAFEKLGKGAAGDKAKAAGEAPTEASAVPLPATTPTEVPSRPR